MIESFLTYLNHQKLITFEDNVLCAVSGGVDSMVMLDLLHRSKMRVGVAHVNHNLRGEESDEDAALVKDYCQTNSLRYHQIKLPIDHFNTGNLQASARKFRYQWFQNIAQDHGYNLIATAHHLEDSVETLFMNLLRGTGIKGLTGIPARNGNIIRPLIWSKKQFIMDYAKEHNIPFREDSTNLTVKYKRNKIRKELLPLIQSIDHRFSNHIGATLNHLKTSSDLLDFFLTKAVQSVGVEKLIDLKELPDDESQGIEALFLILQPYGFSKDCAKNIIMNKGATHRYCSESYRISHQGTQVILCPYSSKSLDFEPTILLINGRTNLSNHITVDAQVVEKQFLESYTSNKIYLDFDKLQGGLTLRQWQPGDRIKPLGMKGKSKLIQDIFTDKKLSPQQKSSSIVLTVDDRIAAILPLATSEEFKIDLNTKKVLILSVI
jgi:tRNA(Ile)-lysidine synthase